MMNFYICLLSFICCGQILPMDRPRDIIECALTNYNPAMGIYVQPSQASGMISLLKRESLLNNLGQQEKRQLEESAARLNKSFLRDLAQTVTIQSECGQNFAVPLKIARETQKINTQLSAQNPQPILLNFNAQLLDLFFKASWYFYYTETLFWMRSYRMLTDENEKDLLRLAGVLGADFIKRTINDTNQRTGKF